MFKKIYDHQLQTPDTGQRMRPRTAIPPLALPGDRLSDGDEIRQRDLRRRQMQHILRGYPRVRSKIAAGLIYWKLSGVLDCLYEWSYAVYDLRREFEAKRRAMAAREQESLRGQRATSLCGVVVASHAGEPLLDFDCYSGERRGRTRRPVASTAIQYSPPHAGSDIQLPHRETRRTQEKQHTDGKQLKEKYISSDFTPWLYLYLYLCSE